MSWIFLIESRLTLTLRIKPILGFFFKTGYYILLPLFEFVPEFSKDPVIPLLPSLYLRGRTLDATLWILIHPPRSQLHGSAYPENLYLRNFSILQSSYPTFTYSDWSLWISEVCLQVFDLPCLNSIRIMNMFPQHWYVKYRMYLHLFRYVETISYLSDLLYNLVRPNESYRWFADLPKSVLYFWADTFK